MTSAADPTGVSSTANSTVAATADVALVVDSTPTANGGETVIVTYTVTNNRAEHGRQRDRHGHLPGWDECAQRVDVWSAARRTRSPWAA